MGYILEKFKSAVLFTLPVLLYHGWCEHRIIIKALSSQTVTVATSQLI